MREDADPSVEIDRSTGRGDKAPDPLRIDAAERAADDAVGEFGWALPLLGVALLVSPLILVAAGELEIWGAPAAFVYVFVAWGGLIILAARLAARAERAARAEERDLALHGRAAAAQSDQADAPD